MLQTAPRKPHSRLASYVVPRFSLDAALIKKLRHPGLSPWRLARIALHPTFRLSHVTWCAEERLL